MDRSKFRIGLITVGIIAGLTLILYLPVLIWSPPLGDRGYYLLQNKLEIYLLFAEENSKIFGLLTSASNRNVSYRADPKLTDKFEHTVYIADKQHWIVSGKKIFADLLWLKTQEGKLFPLKTEGHPGFNKIANPFTLWYIKWLEWTSD